MVDVLLELVVAFGCDADDDGVACLDLFDVRECLFVNAFLRRERDDRNTLDNQSERAMLELAGSIRLGMDIGNLLELQRTFERDIVVERTADVEDIFIEAILLCKRLDRLDIRKRLADLRRDFLELGHEFCDTLFWQRAQNLCHVEREHEEQDELRRVGFRRGDSDFRAGPGIEHLIRFTRDGRADDVRQCERLGAAALRLFERGQRIARLAGLGDDNQHRLFIDDRVAIAELGRDVHFDRDARELFDVVFAHEAGMVRRAAGNDIDFVEVVEIVGRPLELVHDDALAVFGDALAHRIANCLRLLVDFLEHEVLETALFGCLGIPVDLEDLLRHELALAVRDDDGILFHDGHLAIVEDIRAARPADDGRDVGCDEVLAVAEADDKRVVLLRADELVRMLAAHEDEGIRTFDAAQHFADAFLEVAIVDLFQEVRNDFRVRLGLERMAFLDELFFERQIVLDDAVMHDDEIARAVRMRMRVDIRRTAVRRPARMADADRALRDIILDFVAERCEAADAFLDADLLTVINRDAG